MSLPTYKLVISDNENDKTEVDFVGLVDRPAIERDFLAFKEKQMLFIEDEDQRIVTGPAMVPDMPIFRKDKEYGEYYVVFEADTISKIVQRFFKKGYQGNINLDHKRKDLVADSVFFESWIVDREKGKQPLKGMDDLPDGTWFLSAKINNDEAWEKIKAGEVKGFSVEGVFEFLEVSEPDPEEEMLEMISQYLGESDVE
ncbi:XkdF-like putative serine protease domain-containing protein [Chitinophaga cymbidii]|uniref:Phage-like element PBSX protein XkdF domain-containing protein n=1 Tax=Chitinophaga cymbidii TaxID=1096750 RepID=A0A512RIN2_9BACT|nr:XkdF-like putative serine protease domain-containing protein [Chitinophaga cymbidii]GEP95566.1 hypothetical protein CCY01nite_18260 [Chitinophaga cymbidii]